MAGKFLGRDAIIDTVKSADRTNAIRKRLGLSRHPIRATSCGCPDPNCGAFHTIRTDTTIPTAAEAAETLAARKRSAARERKRIHSSALIRAEAVAEVFATRPGFAQCRVSVLKDSAAGKRIVVHVPRSMAAAERKDLLQIAAGRSLPFPCTIVVH